MKRGLEQRLALGEIATLKGNFIEKRMRIAYAGQYAPEQFSIAVIISYGNNSYAYNLYFSSHQKEIIIPYGTLTVIEANEYGLYFMYRPD